MPASPSTGRSSRSTSVPPSPLNATFPERTKASTHRTTSHPSHPSSGGHGPRPTPPSTARRRVVQGGHSHCNHSPAASATNTAAALTPYDAHHDARSSNTGRHTDHSATHGNRRQSLVPQQQALCVDPSRSRSTLPSTVLSTPDSTAAAGSLERSTAANLLRAREEADFRDATRLLSSEIYLPKSRATHSVYALSRRHQHGT
ncbi:hypothetical protein OF83DRAFT_1157648 [Amylostereum chailletii]|nr:hypothetical protein OF83DRAFT_1157648 [Amylostereum chailletii]